MKMQIEKRAKEIKEHPRKDETIFVTIITHKTLIDHYLSDVSGTILIDEPVQVWEQRHFQFPASYRAIRELIVPQHVHADYDGDLNANIDADTQAAFVGRISGSQVRVNLDVLYCTTVRSSGPPPPPNADRLAVRAKWTHWNSARTLSTTSSSAPKMTNIDENGAVSRRPSGLMKRMRLRRKNTSAAPTTRSWNTTR